MNSAPETVVISRRYCGPPESANGGYTCGLIARHLEGTARVRLHRPPPLEQPLSFRVPEAGRLSLMHDDELVAEGHVTGHEMEVPRPVSFEEAVEASAGYRWSTGHPFPRCFVCGPERHTADGLRIFPGPVPGRAIVAAPWIPDDTVCDDTGHVRLEVLWAALDCPSWFGVLEVERLAGLALLGQLTARVSQRPAANERCVVTGWSRGRDGRKLYGGAALFTSAGTLIGSSDAIWIELKS